MSKTIPKYPQGEWNMKKKRKNRSALLSLLFFLLIIAFVGTVSLADDKIDKQAQAAREAQDQPPAAD